MARQKRVWTRFGLPLGSKDNCPSEQGDLRGKTPKNCGVADDLRNLWLVLAKSTPRIAYNYQYS